MLPTNLIAFWKLWLLASLGFSVEPRARGASQPRRPKAGVYRPQNNGFYLNPGVMSDHWPCRAESSHASGEICNTTKRPLGYYFRLWAIILRVFLVIQVLLLMTEIL